MPIARGGIRRDDIVVAHKPEHVGLETEISILAARISTLIHDILVRTPDFFVVTSYPAPNRDLKAYFDLAPPTRNGQVPSTEKGIVARPLAISVGVIASLFWPTGAEVYRSWSAVVADPDLRGSSTLVVNRLGSSELRGRWRFSELITIEPKWGKENQHRPLTPVCREAFKRIDLRWHDLRHEYASRLVERGVPLSQVRDLLGNASIATTERYDNRIQEALFEAAKRLETGESFKIAYSNPYLRRDRIHG